MFEFFCEIGSQAEQSTAQDLCASVKTMLVEHMAQDALHDLENAKLVVYVSDDMGDEAELQAKFSAKYVKTERLGVTHLDKSRQPDRLANTLVVTLVQISKQN